MIKLKKFLSVIFSVMIISQQAAIAEDNVNEEMQCKPYSGEPDKVEA